MWLKRKCGCVSVVRVIVHIAYLSRALDVIIVGQFRLPLPVSLATTETMEKLIRSAFEIRDDSNQIIESIVQPHRILSSMKIDCVHTSDAHLFLWNNVINIIVLINADDLCVIPDCWLHNNLFPINLRANEEYSN